VVTPPTRDAEYLPETPGVVNESSPTNAVTPRFFQPIGMPASDPPRLCVVVDTEEEFDWQAPLSREAVGVTAIAEVWRLQRLTEPLGIVPTYVVDFPVAATATSARVFRDLVSRRVAEVGAHLHPWVSPPHEEVVCNRASFACNLGAPLEFAKLAALTRAIEDGIGVRPRVYKAGRYGFGLSTADALENLGFDVDVSVNPHMDYRPIEGPSFAGIRAVPARFGRKRTLLEVPCTTGFVGIARTVGEALHRVASKAERLRGLGVLARAGVLNRVMLSPEGSTLTEMIAVTRALLADGVRTFALTLHSPTLKPGCTPYARSAADRDALLTTIDRYFHFFFHELNGAPSTPATLFDELSKGTAA